MRCHVSPETAGAAPETARATARDLRHTESAGIVLYFVTFSAILLQQVQESLRDATSHQRQQELLLRQQELQLEISVIQNQQVEFCF